MNSWNHSRYLTAIANIGMLIERGETHLAAEASQRLLDAAVNAGETAYADAPIDLAAAYFQQGRVLQMVGAAADALAPLREAKRRFRRLISRNPHCEQMALAVLTEIADCLEDLDGVEEAANVYVRVIHAHQAKNRVGDAAAAQIQLALLRVRQGRHPEAITVFTEARDAFSRLNDHAAVAETWRQLGLVSQELHRFDEAEDAYRQGLQVAVQRHFPTLEAFILGQLGLLHAARGRLEAAAPLLRQAIALLERVGPVDATAAANLQRQLRQTLAQTTQ